MEDLLEQLGYVSERRRSERNVIVWSTRERFLYGLRRAVGVGLIIGAFEGVVAGFGLRLTMGLADHLLFLCVSIAVNGLVGLIVGLLLGLPIHLLLRRRCLPSRSERIITHFWSCSSDFSSGLLLWRSGDRAGFWPPVSWHHAAVRRAVGFLNGAWLVRRMEGGVTLPVRFWWVVADGPIWCRSWGWRSTRFVRREAGRPRRASNVLLISVDTLRRDHVGAYGVPTAARTPRLDALAAEGTLFLDAVTPMPERHLPMARSSWVSSRRVMVCCRTVISFSTAGRHWRRSSRSGLYHRCLRLLLCPRPVDGSRCGP